MLSCESGYVNGGFENDAPTRSRMASEKEKIYQPVVTELSRALQSRTQRLD